MCHSSLRYRIPVLPALALAGVSLLASCGVAPSLEVSSSEPMALEQAASTGDASTMNTLPGEPALSPTQPQLIQQGEVILEVDGLDEALDELRALVRQQGGDVVTLEVNEGDRRHPQALLRVRLPQGELERTINALQDIGTLRQQRITAEDVSTQLVDLEARLRNLRQTEASLLKIMERSGSMADVLAVSKEVSAARQQIEQIDAQRQHLRNQVAFSTLTITLETTAIARPQRPPLLPQLGETWHSASDSLQGVTVGLLRFGVWWVVYSPYWLGMGAIAWALQRRRRKFTPSLTSTQGAPPTLDD